MTSELSWQRNDAVTNFTCKRISRHWELFFQNRSREQFSPIAAAMKVFWLDMFLINFPSGNAKILKLIAKHILECFEKRKGEDGKK